MWFGKKTIHNFPFFSLTKSCVKNSIVRIKQTSWESLGTFFSIFMKKSSSCSATIKKRSKILSFTDVFLPLIDGIWALRGKDSFVLFSFCIDPHTSYLYEHSSVSWYKHDRNALFSVYLQDPYPLNASASCQDKSDKYCWFKTFCWILCCFFFFYTCSVDHCFIISIKIS